MNVRRNTKISLDAEVGDMIQYTRKGGKRPWN